MSAETDAQREVTRVALAGIAGAGFALAGSGAIREHGVSDRPTEDVDLFTPRQDSAEFGRAVERVVADLRGSGYEVEEVRRVEQFARLQVRTAEGLQLDVDLGVDWRANAPVRLDVGPVLSLEDAVGNKVSAVYSRGEPRDYLDLDAIRGSGRFTDEELVNAVAERDAGFEVSMFAQQLEAVHRVTLLDVERYGITAEQLDGIKERCTRWAADLRRESETTTAEAARPPGLHRSPLSASYPRAATEAARGGAEQSGVAPRRGGPYLPGRGYGGGGRGEGR